MLFHRFLTRNFLALNYRFDKNFLTVVYAGCARENELLKFAKSINLRFSQNLSASLILTCYFACVEPVCPRFVGPLWPLENFGVPGC